MKMGIHSLTLAVALFCSTAHADEWLGRDKALHFGASAILSSTAYGVTTAFDDRRSVAFIVGSGVALTAGIAKETYDALGYGDPSWKDLAWDVAGTLVGLGIAYGVDAIFRREPTSTTNAALVRF
jgi:putative lipoprotein